MKIRRQGEFADADTYLIVTNGVLGTGIERQVAEVGVSIEAAQVGAAEIHEKFAGGSEVADVLVVVGVDDGVAGTERVCAGDDLLHLELGAGAMLDNFPSPGGEAIAGLAPVFFGGVPEAAGLETEGSEPEGVGVEAGGFDGAGEGEGFARLWRLGGLDGGNEAGGETPEAGGAKGDGFAGGEESAVGGAGGERQDDEIEVGGGVDFGGWLWGHRRIQFYLVILFAHVP